MREKESEDGACSKTGSGNNNTDRIGNDENLNTKQNFNVDKTHGNDNGNNNTDKFERGDNANVDLDDGKNNNVVKANDKTIGNDITAQTGKGGNVVGHFDDGEDGQIDSVDKSNGNTVGNSNTCTMQGGVISHLDEGQSDAVDGANGNINRVMQDMEFLSCLVCSTSFSKKSDLMKHLSKIHRLTNLCTLCYFQRTEIHRSSNPVSLRNHKLRAHSKDMVHCVCGSLFIDEKMLASHLKKFKCDIRKAEDKEMDMIKCVCGKRFVNEELLSSHKILKCRKRSSGLPSDKQLNNIDYKLTLDTTDYGQGVDANINARQSATVSYADVYSVNETEGPKGHKTIPEVTFKSNTENVCNESYRAINSSLEPNLKTDPNNNMVEDFAAVSVDLNMNMVKVGEDIHEKLNEQSLQGHNECQLLASSTKPSDILEKFGTSSAPRGYKSLLLASSTKPEKCCRQSLQMKTRHEMRLKRSSIIPNMKGHHPCTEVHERFDETSVSVKKGKLLQSSTLTRIKNQIQPQLSGKEGSPLQTMSMKTKQSGVKTRGHKDEKKDANNNKKNQVNVDDKVDKTLVSGKEDKLLQSSTLTRIKNQAQHHMLGKESSPLRTMSMKTDQSGVKTSGHKDEKKDGNSKKKKGSGKPDAEGRYPCKVCKRRFKRPYLYVHQKQVHAKKQWVLTTAAPAGKSYRCGWCNFTTIYWRSIVTHHYKMHQDMELNVSPIFPGCKTEAGKMSVK